MIRLVKIFSLVISFSIGFYQNCKAEEIKINDEFKQVLLTYMPEIDRDSDKIISEKEARLVSEIRLPDAGLNEIQGLKYFVNLEKLILSRNKLTEVSLKDMPKLEVVDCYSNNLSNLELENLPSLKKLNVGSNELKQLDVNHLISLEVLVCGHNKLKKLDVSNLANLTFLGIVSNQIEFIDISQNVLLQTFQFNFNPMREMDLSNNPNLIFDSRFSWDQNVKLKATKSQMEAIQKNHEEEIQNSQLEIEEMTIED